MKYLYSIQAKHPRKKLIIEELQCPTLSAAVFMIGRIAEGVKYRIKKQQLNSERLYFYESFEGPNYYNADGHPLHGNIWT